MWVFLPPTQLSEVGNTDPVSVRVHKKNFRCHQQLSHSVREHSVSRAPSITLEKFLFCYFRAKLLKRSQMLVIEASKIKFRGDALVSPFASSLNNALPVKMKSAFL